MNAPTYILKAHIKMLEEGIALFDQNAYEVVSWAFSRAYDILSEYDQCEIREWLNIMQDRYESD